MQKLFITAVIELDCCSQSIDLICVINILEKMNSCAHMFDFKCLLGPALLLSNCELPSNKVNFIDSLSGANFEKADLKWSLFKGATLKGCNFNSANMEGVNLIEANMEESDLRFTDLDGVNLAWSHIKNAIF